METILNQFDFEIDPKSSISRGFTILPSRPPASAVPIPGYDDRHDSHCSRNPDLDDVLDDGARGGPRAAKHQSIPEPNREHRWRGRGEIRGVRHDPRQ